MATLIGFGKKAWCRVNQVFQNDKPVKDGLKWFMSNHTDSDMSELAQTFSSLKTSASMYCQEPLKS